MIYDMKETIKFSYIFILFFIIFPIRCVGAAIDIWKVGKPNVSGEFVFSEKRVINYQVPSDWEILIRQDDPNWGEFPSFIYPNNEQENNPQEIRLNYSYLSDYSNPILKIRARILYIADIHHNIQVFKGDKEFFIDQDEIIISSYQTYEFPLGYIEKGIHEKNSIIIRSTGPSNKRIYFDNIQLYLDDTDSDGDGVMDTEEGDAYLDQTTAQIQIKSYMPNPVNKKNITLYLEKTGETIPVFREVKFIDPNLFNIPDSLCPNYYLPYELLSFKIEGIGPETRVNFQFKSTEALSASSRFFAYQDANEWQEINFELIDANIASILLNDGGEGDLDTVIDGKIYTILAFFYPEGLGVQVERKGCFLNTLLWRR